MKFIKFCVQISILLVLTVFAPCSHTRILDGTPNNSESITLFESDTSIEDESKYLDGADHPCYRACVAGESMTCHYDFTLEQYHTMSKACYDCPKNDTDCYRKDCIMADGAFKSVVVVNRRFPGPKIEVCLDDTIIVDLHNKLLDESTTIHWHGLHMRDTPYMDGVPMVTQCAIPVGATFRYEFPADNSGTHFWHSHFGMQRIDGDTGVIIIREPKDPHKLLYDYDLSEHIIHMKDWVHKTRTDVFTGDRHSGIATEISSLLINGKGRYNKPNAPKTPFERFNVRKGFRYRFRVIDAGFFVCPIQISVERHNITIISSDGNSLNPVEAASLVMYPGERFDFIINANQPVNNYRIMFRGFLACANLISQIAILHYDGASENTKQFKLPLWKKAFNQGLQINPLNRGSGHKDTLAVSELTTLEADDETLKEIPDFKYFIAYDFFWKDNPTYNKYPYYGVNQVKEKYRTRLLQLNHISMEVPSHVLMAERDKLIPDQHFCNESNVHNCMEEFCSCTHVVNIPLNAVVELIFVDEGVMLDGNHPMHLHGYAFRVIGMEKLGKSTSIEEVKKLDAEGKMRRNLKGAPIKDTVTVPDGGYTVIRFLANNPGYWLLHCHLEYHEKMGMGLVVKVGEHDDFQPVPDDFPTCGGYSTK